MPRKNTARKQADTPQEDAAQRACASQPQAAGPAGASQPQAAAGPAGASQPKGAHPQSRADDFARTATLQFTDWNEEWRHLQRIRRAYDDNQYWNKRSKNYSTKDAPNPYVRQFLEFAGVQPAETVMDMGCGTGSLAVPLALDGHHVVAADFSQGMLDELGRRADLAGATDITTHLMSWADDWAAHGIAEKSVDVAFASRSIATDDMREALMKLTSVARRRCCVTLTTGCSPRMDTRMMAACGLRNLHGKDFQYAWNILVNEGFEPSVNYILSQRQDTYASIDEAMVDFGRMIDDIVDADDEAGRQAARAKMHALLQDNLVPNENAGLLDAKGYPQGALKLRTPRVITWAFIAWNV